MKTKPFLHMPGMTLLIRNLSYSFFCTYLLKCWIVFEFDLIVFFRYFLRPDKPLGTILSNTVVGVCLSLKLSGG